MYGVSKAVCRSDTTFKWRLTAKTNAVFKIVHTRTNTPAPRMTVDATFLTILRLDLQSMGRGIKMR
jgi:hypothetical protein